MILCKFVVSFTASEIMNGCYEREPVAAILPYKEYIILDRIRSYISLQELSKALKDFAITVKEVYTESKAELENRGVI